MLVSDINTLARVVILSEVHIIVAICSHVGHYANTAVSCGRPDMQHYCYRSCPLIWQ